MWSQLQSAADVLLFLAAVASCLAGTKRFCISPVWLSAFAGGGIYSLAKNVV